MKKKKSVFIAILSVMALLAMTLGLTGCRPKGKSLDDIPEENNIVVTFDWNGGIADSSSSSSTETPDEDAGEDEEEEEDATAKSFYRQYVTYNSLLVLPGSFDNGAAGSIPKKEGYTLNGYYVAQLDAGGNVQKDASENPVLLRQWNFQTDKVTEDMTLVANWYQNYTLTVKYGENYEQEETIVIKQDENGTPTPLTGLTIKNYEIVNIFESEAEALAYKNEKTGDENRITFDAPNYYTPSKLTQAKDGNEAVLTQTIWANTLEGNWTLVRNKNDFSLNVGTNLYLMANLDYEGEKLALPTSYGGKFEGNGYTISNFKIEQEQGNRTANEFGLFRKVEATAQIRNVTFQNMTYVGEITVPFNTVKEKTYHIGVFAGTVVDGAKVENVTFSGGTFTLNYKIVETAENTLVIDAFAGAKPNDFDQTTFSSTVVAEKVKWVKVTFHSNGGTGVDAITMVAGSTISEPEPPEKAASKTHTYTFVGWYTDKETFENAWNFEEDVVEEDMTLYAKWEEQKITA